MVMPLVEHDSDLPRLEARQRLAVASRDSGQVHPVRRERLNGTIVRHGGRGQHQEQKHEFNHLFLLLMISFDNTLLHKYVKY